MSLWRAMGSLVIGAVALGGATLGGALALGQELPAAAATPLVGTFTITAGSCSGGVATGTYLRMVLSGGTNTAGPYFSNSDSSCSDDTYTPLAPGADRGLVTGSYQPEPSPAFDGSGNALAGLITAPVAFEGVRFATATNPVDPQTGLHVPAPSIALDGSALSGNVQSFAVSWNNQQFNQGSPKPDGSSPGNTTPVTGVYNPSTGAYTLQWSSQVVGGPFNGFSAFWNLTGIFIPAASSSGAAGAPASGPAASGVASSPGTSAPAPAAGHAGGTSSSSAAPASSAAGTGAAIASAKTTTTTTAAAGRAPGATAREAAVESSHTSVSGDGGWSAPTWLVVLLALVAVLGLAGVLWSERELRRRRGVDGLEPKGASS
jgi:hypothetical protein